MPADLAWVAQHSHEVVELFLCIGFELIEGAGFADSDRLLGLQVELCPEIRIVRQVVVVRHFSVEEVNEICQGVLHFVVGYWWR